MFSSIQDVKKSLVKLNQTEIELTQSLTAQVEFDTVAFDLDFNLNGLSTVISKTFDKSILISSRVKSLDVEQSRIKQTLKLLVSIKELNGLVHDLRVSIQAADLPVSSNIVKNYLMYDLESIKKIFQNSDGEVGFGICPIDELETLRMDLLDLIITEFDERCLSGNGQRVYEILKLFPMIGRADLGLDKYSAYLCGMISNNVNQSLKKMLDQKGMGHVDVLVYLFEGVARVVDSHVDLLDISFGDGSFDSVLLRLVREVDLQSLMVLGMFEDSKKISRKVTNLILNHDFLRTALILDSRNRGI